MYFSNRRILDKGKTKDQTFFICVIEDEGSKIVSYENVQYEILSKTNEFQDDLTYIYYQVEELEQYNSGTSLRFPNVPMQYIKNQTDQTVLDFVNIPPNFNNSTLLQQMILTAKK